jgi:hypothetical protein
MMSAIQLRRYNLIPAEVDGFVGWWLQNVVPVRQQFGFRVVFAYIDRENATFSWAVTHDGDFDAAEAEYYGSDARAAAAQGQPKRVLHQEISKVEAVMNPA